MAEAFAQYINDLGLKDSFGKMLLTLDGSPEEGIYQSGTYYGVSGKGLWVGGHH